MYPVLVNVEPLRVIDLPNGSTPIDFAYSIHSAVGNRMVGARVNGQMVTIDHVLQNGDRVEITTSQNSKGPSRDWLNIVKSTQAKNKINQWFRNEFKEDNIAKGRVMFNDFCKQHSIDPSLIMTHEYVKAILNKYGFKEWDACLAAIGHGGLKEGQIVNKMLELYEADHPTIITNEDVLKSVAEAPKKEHKNVKGKGGIIVKGIDDVAVRFSKCCSPIPGDEIVGFVTRGRGISIHRIDCVNMLHLPDSELVRLIDAEWQQQEKTGEKYVAEIVIYSTDKQGVLASITKVLTEKNISINTMNSKLAKQGTATTSISFEIANKEELNRVIDKLNSLEEVIDIERTMG